MAHRRLADIINRLFMYEAGSRVRITDVTRMVAERGYLTRQRIKNILRQILMPEVMQGHFFLDIKLVW